MTKACLQGKGHGKKIWFILIQLYYEDWTSWKEIFLQSAHNPSLCIQTKIADTLAKKSHKVPFKKKKKNLLPKKQNKN